MSASSEAILNTDDHLILCIFSGSSFEAAKLPLYKGRQDQIKS